MTPTSAARRRFFAAALPASLSLRSHQMNRMPRPAKISCQRALASLSQ
jgi:hypothetical protein